MESGISPKNALRIVQDTQTNGGVMGRVCKASSQMGKLKLKERGQFIQCISTPKLPGFKLGPF